MEIRNLETFVMLNELRNFTQTAEKLGYTQSTVSFQIKQLEDELGLPLFERLNHSVSLTSEGEKLLPLALDIIRLSTQASQLSKDPSQIEGTIRIAIAESLASWQFRSSFQEFHKLYPDIHLKLISASTTQMFQLLSQNQVDLVYTLDQRIINHKYQSAFESPVEICFVCSPKHPYAALDTISIHDILKTSLILTEKNMSYRTLLDEALAIMGKEAHPLMEVGDTHLICELLRQGLGISFLPKFVVESDLQSGTLVCLSVPEIAHTIWRQLLMHRNKWISPALSCVIEYLKQ